MKASKAVPRLWEVIQDELERSKEQRFKELREKAQEAEAEARKNMIRAKLLRKRRSA